MRKVVIAAVLLLLIGALAWSMPLPGPEDAASAETRDTTLFDAPVSASAGADPAVWTFPEGSTIGGRSVVGMTLEQAQRTVELAFGEYRRPLYVLVGSEVLTLQPEQIGVRIDAAQVVSQAQAWFAQSSTPHNFPLDVPYDQQALDAWVAGLAAQVDRAPQLSYDQQRAAFVITPGATLDTAGTIERIVAQLSISDSDRRVSAAIVPVLDGPHVAPEQLDYELQAIATRFTDDFSGTLGIAVMDLDGNVRYAMNQHTVFSGVSIMKIGIMLQFYTSVTMIDEEQREWLELMMMRSDNMAANELLAEAALTTIGERDAYAGVQLMDQMLTQLGLTHTGMIAPYESVAFLTDVMGLELGTLEHMTGEPPYTAADPYLRTTPAEMGYLMQIIGQCAIGRGPLLDLYPQTLSPERCEEMLRLMRANPHRMKLTAGIPEGVRVAHKPGWSDDIRAEVGLVGQGEDALIISLWLWANTDFLPNEYADPLMADISRTIYTAFHPQMPHP